MKEKLFIPLNATKSTGTSNTSPTERPNKSIELGKWILRFFGISPQGSSNLVLNQQGDWVTVDKSTIGLGNVDNTSDSNKPISTATQNALDLKANKSEVATVLFKSITQTIVTGKTEETSIYSIPLPMDGFDYMINVYSQAQVTTFLGAGITQRFRVGSFASPIDGTTGTNSIGLQTILATNGVASPNQIPLKRNFTLYGGASGSIYGLATGGNIPDDANTLWSFTSLASKDFTVQNYLYVTFNPSNVGAVVQHNQILVTAIKI